MDQNERNKYRVSRLRELFPEGEVSRYMDKSADLNDDQFEQAINAKTKSMGRPTRALTPRPVAPTQPRQLSGVVRPEDIGPDPASNEASKRMGMPVVAGPQQDIGLGDQWSSGNRVWRTREELRQEAAILGRDADDFDKFRQQLHAQSGRMDPLGKSAYNDIQKKSMALMNAWTTGKLRPIEYLRGMKKLQEQSNLVNWQSHIAPEGTQPGEIMDTPHGPMTKTRDGETKVLALSPEFVRKNTTHLGGGQVVVPRAQDGNIVSEQIDMSPHLKEIDKRFDEQYKENVKSFQQSNGRLPGVNPTTGKLGDTPEMMSELENFSKGVESQVVSMMTTRERLYQRISDHTLASAKGEPLPNEVEAVAQQQFQQENEKQRGILQEAASANEQQLQQTQFQKAERSFKAKKIMQDRGIEPQKEPELMDALTNWPTKPALLNAVMNPIPAPKNRKDGEALFEKSPDGTVFLMPNMKRVMKYKGKAIPIDYDEVMSNKSKVLQNAPELTDIGTPMGG